MSASTITGCSYRKPGALLELVRTVPVGGTLTFDDSWEAHKVMAGARNHKIIFSKRGSTLTRVR